MTVLLEGLGEKRLVQTVFANLLSRASQRLDDCAIVDIENGSLAITMDAGPRKTFLRLLEVGTPADLGHFFATMSLSDLAAAGSIPILLVAAFLLPTVLDLDFVEGLAAGVAEACSDVGASYVGGDTKSSSELRVVTTGVGIIGARPLSRAGARSGDLVFVSGQLGRTLSSYIEAHRTGAAVLRPLARVTDGRWLADTGVASSCTDMSDGPLASAAAIAEASVAEVHLDVSLLNLAEAPSGVDADSWRNLVLGTGCDFELMFTARREAEALLLARGFIRCGEVTQQGSARVLVAPASADLPSWEHFSTTDVFESILRGLT